MDQKEKNIIENLFERLQQAEAQSGARDSEAEELIRKAIARQPAAPYYMAQAILVQEQALKNLNDRIQELERELKQRPTGGSFLAGLFGGAQEKPTSGGDRPATTPPPSSSRIGASPLPARGSGFLGSALQTATAVAGGMLLANAISGMFTNESGAALAEEPSPAPPSADENPIEDDFGDDFGDEGFEGDFGDDF